MSRAAPVERQRSPALRSASADAVAAAADVLRSGGLVAFATETVYGLGADATQDEAVAKIFQAKGRPHFNPLIVHVASLEEAGRYAEFSPEARALAAAFWPGPLTLVVPLRDDAGLSRLVTAGLRTVALRVPAHATALALLAAAGRPLAAPSANRSGRVSPTTARHVLADLADGIDLILDSGPCPAGIESTIVDAGARPPRLLRPGAIPRESIEAITGPLSTPCDHFQLVAPGMMKSHYAPRARLRLDAVCPQPGEAYLAFGPDAPAWPLSLNLSPAGDLEEAAANLYAHLRALDAQGASTIAVAPIPGKGLGEAINDRLRRAASPRSGTP